MLDVGLNPTPGAKIKVDFLIFYVINIIMKNNIFKILFNIAKNKTALGFSDYLGHIFRSFGTIMPYWCWARERSVCGWAAHKSAPPR